jgi:outer membrane protein assembly factor BamB
MDETTRRAILKAAAGSAAVAGASGSVRGTVQQSSESWPQYQFDSANTGYAPDNTPVTTEPTEQWRVLMDGDLQGPPEVSGASVYMAANDEVYRVDARDGTEQWATMVDDAVYGSPAVSDDTVYVGTYNGSLYALNASDGSQRWSREGMGENYLTSPTVTGNSVYTGDEGGYLYAVDAKNGSENWRFYAESESSGNDTHVSSPTLSDGIAYVATNDGSVSDLGDVYALDSSDGSVIWRSAIDVDVLEYYKDTSPIVGDGGVFVGTFNSGLYALNKADGSVSWQYGEDGWFVHASFSGRVFATKNQSQTFYAFDTATGSVSWQVDSYEKDPIFVDSTVYLRDSSGFRAIDTTDGTTRWQTELDSSDVNSSESGSETADMEQIVYPGSYAVSLPDRRKIWEFKPAGSIETTPTVASGRTVVPGSGYIPALSSETGSEEWNAFAYSDAPPAMRDGTVYLPKSDGIEALAVEDGSTEWHYEQAGNAISPVVTDTSVYFSDHNSIYALERESGNLRWEVEATAGNGRFSVAYADRILYAYVWDAGGYILRAIDSRDGSILWETETDVYSITPPAVYERFVYWGSDGQRGGERYTGLHAVDASSGEELWATEFPVSGSPAVAEGTVYTGSRDGSLYALGAENGAEQWTFTTDGPITAPPIVVGNTVYVGSNDNHLYALSADDGTERWRFETGDDVVAAPAVANGTVYLPSTDGYLYALSAEGSESVSTQQNPNTETETASTTNSTANRDQVGLFEQFGDETALPLGLAGGGLLGAAGLGAYRWLRERDDE